MVALCSLCSKDGEKGKTNFLLGKLLEGENTLRVRPRLTSDDNIKVNLRALVSTNGTNQDRTNDRLLVSTYEYLCVCERDS